VEDATRQAAEFGDGFWMIYKVLRKSGRMWNHKKVIWLNGKPKNIRCDNGPEFIATDFQNWCKGNEINILFTQPGCPTQNSYIERFNGSYRRAVLDAYIFRNLNEAREQTEIWRTYYNEQRPHESLDNMTPIEYRMNKAV
jgi:putative transposase